MSIRLIRIGPMLFALALLMAFASPRGVRAAEPTGEMTWGVHFTVPPTWFDPAEVGSLITPYMFMYALHDALLKPMPDTGLTPSLAESWTMSPDGLTYDFTLRPNVTFHDGSPVTSEDARFTFERFRSAGASTLKAHVVAVETPDARHIRFRLNGPWPDFPLFYSVVSGAA